MGELVRYNNDMNLIQFNKFKDKELDLFFSICYKMKEKGVEEIILDFEELKELSRHTRKDRMIKDLKTTYDKLIALNFEIKEREYGKNRDIKFVLFTRYIIDYDDKNVKIKVNEEFKHILNQLGETYTKFELEQFISLKSTYSKHLFKILKQWDALKEKKFKIDEFRKVLDIPVSYNLSKINEKVLKPIRRELTPYFYDLKIEKIKKGRKIIELKFTWATQNMKQVKLLEIEIVISEKLEKTIEKTKKNKFINPVLTKENKKKLLEIFGEKILINAFNKAYTEIKKEINFNYLKTFIENTLKQQEIKFTVVKGVEDIETIEEKTEKLKTETRAPKEKIKVNEEEKKQKYEEYLKENNLQDNKFNKKSFEVVFNNDFELAEEETKLIERANKEYKNITPNSREDKEGRIFPKEFESYESWMDYNKDYRGKNPEIMMKMKEEAEEKKEKDQARNQYLKYLKSIEFDLIISDDKRLEEFQSNFMRFFRLHDYIQDELKYAPKEKIIYAEIKLQNLQEYFEQFESDKEQEEILNFEDIKKEKLLSKNGKKLFGGALISRLKKIAKEMKKNIKYKDQIISF